MAKSGIVSKTYTSGVSGGKITFNFSWTLKSQDLNNNTSTIDWVYSFNVSGLSYSDNSVNFYGTNEIKIDGVTVATRSDFPKTSFSDLDGITASYDVCTGTTTINHNLDGNKTFSIDLTIGTLGGGISNSKSMSGSGELDPISRNGKLISAPNFNDEQNPTITYTCPAGSSATSLQACISFTGEADNIGYRDIPKGSGGSTQLTYTFNLTSTEKSTLYTLLNNGTTATVRFYIKTVINGTTYLDYQTRTLTFINYTPTLSPTIYDTNSRTTTLTGNRNILVKYMSDAYFSTGATARKGATIDNQYIKNGDQTIGNKSTGTITGITSNTFYLSVTDSRGYTTQDAKTFSVDNGYFIEYVKLTCNVTTEEMTAEGRLVVHVTGKYFNGSFGKTNNTLELEYGLKKENGDINWVKLGTVTPTTDANNNYEYTFTITGLDYLSVYNLTVNAIDEVMPQPSTQTVIVAAKPVFDWDKNDFAHYTDVIIENDKSIYGVDTSGAKQNIISFNQYNNLSIGYGNSTNRVQQTSIQGKSVSIAATNTLYLNGREYGANKVLWSGASHMNATQTATLSEGINKQPTGIVLVFSLYRNDAAEDTSIQTFFISKKEVELLPGKFHTFLLGINAGFSVIGAKYLGISDTLITGNTSNTATGTSSGITYNNSNFVLRYVIGV